MRKRLLISGLLLLIISGIAASIVFIPNPLGRQIIAAVKAQGYLPYTPDEAVTLAYNRCNTCHDIEKVLKYCSRCGPPFIVVAHTMKKHVELANIYGETVEQFSDTEIIVITEVWNALIGNWEADWRQQDLKKLLRKDRALIRFVETPVAQRPIEQALKHKTAPGSYKEVQFNK